MEGRGEPGTSLSVSVLCVPAVMGVIRAGVMVAGLWLGTSTVSVGSVVMVTEFCEVES